MPERNKVIVVTTDTVPGRRIVDVGGLLVATGYWENAYNDLIQQAATSGANAIVGFRWATGNGGTIGYGTAVTIE